MTFFFVASSSKRRTLWKIGEKIALVSTCFKKSPRPWLLKQPCRTKRPGWNSTNRDFRPDQKCLQRTEVFETSQNPWKLELLWFWRQLWFWWKHLENLENHYRNHRFWSRDVQGSTPKKAPFGALAIPIPGLTRAVAGPQGHWPYWFLGTCGRPGVKKIVMGVPHNGWFFLRENPAMMES